VTDCKMVKTGFDRGPGDRPRSALHADWQRFWSAVQKFDGELNVLWTKAHVVARDLRLGRSNPMDAYGNTAADKLAEIGAARCSVSNADAEAYQAETKLAGQVQRRRLAILLDILSHTEKVKKPKKRIKRKATSTLVLLKNTSHKLVIADGRYRCCHCFKRCPVTLTQKRAFLRNKCHGNSNVEEPRVTEEPKAVGCQLGYGFEHDECQLSQSGYDEAEGDPLGHGGDLDNVDEDFQGDAGVARLPQSHDCVQRDGDATGEDANEQPAHGAQPPVLSEEQMQVIAARHEQASARKRAIDELIRNNRETALERKRLRDDGLFRDKWAENWQEFEVVPQAMACEGAAELDSEQQLRDHCLEIQVDEQDNYTEHQKRTAESIMNELDAAEGFEEEELRRKRQRLEELQEPEAQPSTETDCTFFPLTQELEALSDDTDKEEETRPAEPARVPPPRRQHPGLDLRANYLLEQVDASHRIRTYRGLAWCGFCGSFAAYIGTSRPHVRSLASTCTFPTAKGQDNLRRLRLDPPKWPHPLKGWPDLTTQRAREALLLEGTAGAA